MLLWHQGPAPVLKFGLVGAGAESVRSVLSPSRNSVLKPSRLGGGGGAGRPSLRGKRARAWKDQSSAPVRE